MKINNTTDRDFDLVFGAKTYLGRIPLHMSSRFRVHDVLVGEFTDGEALARCCAVIGLCWAADEPLQIPTLRECGYDMIEFGEHVYDALFALDLAEDVVAPAFAARQIVIESIPTRGEVEEAADPTEAQGESFTAIS